MSGSVFAVLSNLANTGITFLQGIFETYGLLAFVTASTMKGLMLLYIIPAEAVTPTYVLMAADTEADVALIALIAATFILIGNTAIFLLARRLGETFVLYRKFHDTRQWHIMETIFKRHGRESLFTLRLVPLIGGLVTIPAALVHFRTRDFLIYSFLGFFTYEAVLGYAAFYGVRMGAILRYETFAPLINFLTALI